MEVIIRQTHTDAVELVARLIVDRITAKPDLILGLATGRTMEDLYQSLSKKPVSFANCQTFNLDEYIGLPPDHPCSYAYYMRKHFFDKVDIELTNARLPDGMAPDCRRAAQDYETSISNCGGIDLQLLGIGETGHIGFNEPLSALMSSTRDKTLTPTTRQQNAEMFGGNPDAVPSRALTMGVGTILEAREIVLLATGAKKADILSAAVEGPLTSRISASAIQLHPNCKVIVDEAAAAKLEAREYYDFVFQNEPEWESFR